MSNVLVGKEGPSKSRFTAVSTPGGLTSDCNIAQIVASSLHACHFLFKCKESLDAESLAQ